jgi:hypothetical protein
MEKPRRTDCARTAAMILNCVLSVTVLLGKSTEVVGSHGVLGALGVGKELMQMLPSSSKN